MTSRFRRIARVVCCAVAFLTSKAESFTPPSLPDLPSDNPLVEACRVGDIEKAKKLLQDGMDVNVIDGQGYFPLQHAVCKGNAALTKILLDYGADVNQEDIGNHETAIGCAQTEDTALFLLSAGADLRRKTGPSRVPTANILFVGAAARGWKTLLETVHKKVENLEVTSGYSSYTALMGAARAGQIETLKMLLKWGAIVDYADDRGETALMSAAFDGRAETVKELLHAGADPNRRMKGGETALSLAVMYCWNPPPGGSRTSAGDVESVVKFLVDSGAEIESRILKLLHESPYFSSDSVCKSHYDYLLRNYQQP